MPRRKATTVSNKDIDKDAPKRKQRRLNTQLSLPERAHVVGSVLVCGQGDIGQLGLGDDEGKLERKRPALIQSLTNVVEVRAGGMHNLVLTNEGRVFSFGCNDEGALGRDSSEDGSEFEPYEVKLPNKALKISAGDSHSACLLEDGRVFAWGSFRDSHGNMGLTLEGNKRLPIDVLPTISCCDIASGSEHLVMLTTNGKVFTLGCGEQGQLGRVSLRSASGETRRGKADLLIPSELKLRHGKPLDAIWTTRYCTFLREVGSDQIWAFGLNNYNQLFTKSKAQVVANPTRLSIKNVNMIAGGQHHTLLLTTDGICYAIGRHDYGRLGIGQGNKDITEMQPIKALENESIVSIACGEAQSYALTDSGKLYAWGMGSNYQLGTGNDDDAYEPVFIVSKQTEGKRMICASGGGQHSIFLVASDEQPKKPVASKSSEKIEVSPSLNKENEIKNGDAQKSSNGTINPGSGSSDNEQQSASTSDSKTAAKRGRKKK